MGTSRQRFDLREMLGAGGVGMVWRAYDRTRRHEVALKTLRRLDGESLARFKNEFRLLAGIHHENLVTLFELHAEDEWFFTMELLENAVAFLDWVRPGRRTIKLPSSPSLPSAESTEQLAVGSDPLMTSPTLPYTPLAGTQGSAPDRDEGDEGADLPRLRGALAQLVRGVMTLHDAGRLHRDLKPSNVLIVPSGRVVVCDFGLVAGKDSEFDTRAVGTPAYMSPEQAGGRPLDEASDWYSIGVMIYRSLQGRLPFEGTPDEIVRRKQQEDPPICDGERDTRLADVAMELLDRNPRRRPRGEDILAVLGETSPSRQVRARRSTAPLELIGRRNELAVLTTAFTDSRRGAVAVLLHGESGVGKSSLVRQLLANLPTDTLVLAGRCHERESVPYKVLDTLVDALAAYLLERSDDDLRELLPVDVGALARMFPVLSRLPGVAELAAAAESNDAYELRSRGFAALRTIVQRVARQRPTVLFIDDLQWGDLDSAPFLLDLTMGSDTPPVLIITAYRSSDAKTSPLLRLLNPQLRSNGVAGRFREVALAPLSDEAAHELAVRLLGAGAGDLATQIAGEAKGSPMFIDVLARASKSDRRHDAGLTLDQLIAQRVADLPAAAQELLAGVAVAGRPTPLAVLRRAGGLTGEAGALALLQAEQLVRTSTIRDEELIEPYHDRVRETMVAQLPEGVARRWHEQLARALEAEPNPDTTALVEHWLRAGKPSFAGQHARAAADRAAAALAFHRAAYFYDLALAHGGFTGDERRALCTAAADALANSGALAEAAARYVEAAEGAGADDAHRLRRYALECLLRGGHLERGLELARAVLGDVGMSLPSGHKSALFEVAWRRAWFKLRGLSYKERPQAEVPPETLRRIDACWSTASGLTMVDPMYGTAFQMRLLANALGAGEVVRATQALCLEIGYSALTGRASRDAHEGFSEGVRKKAAELGPGVNGLATGCSAIAAFLAGDFRRALDEAVRGSALLMQAGPGYRWQADLARIYQASALAYMGKTGELARIVPTLLRDASERGDVYLANGLRGWRSNVTWLAQGQPEEARAMLRASGFGASQRFHLFHYYELVSDAQIDLYTGLTAEAWARVSSTRKSVKHAMLMRIQSIRIELAYLEARTALALSASTPARRQELDSEISQAARALDKEQTPWSMASAELVRGAHALLGGQKDLARGHLEQAVARCEATDLGLHAAAARWRLGELVGGDEGAAHVRAAKRFLASELVREPERMLAMVLPGPA